MVKLRQLTCDAVLRNSEEYIGIALREAKIPREAFFIATKATTLLQ
jgi:aryl-alcohol dehydrogenase-like predicted oxidoreductase